MLMLEAEVEAAMDMLAVAVAMSDISMDIAEGAGRPRPDVTG